MVFAPVLDDSKQPLVGMVPGVAGLIVWRSRKVAQRQALAPVGLTFEIAPVTAGAKARIHLLTQGDLLSVVGVGLGGQGRCLRLEASQPDKLWGHTAQDNEQNTQPAMSRAE